MRAIQFLFYASLTLAILTACTGTTPEPNLVVDETPTLSLTTETPAPNKPTAPTIKETPTPLPTVTPTPPPPRPDPTPTPEEVSVAYNPDLDFAQVIFVRATQGSDDLWKFETTVRHHDEGWDHYADAWQVVDVTGNVLAERVLAHPHDTEQPFTRSQSNIDIPPDLIQVIVRAKCNVHGFGGQEVVVDLTATEGEGFEVVRP